MRRFRIGCLHVYILTLTTTGWTGSARMMLVGVIERKLTTAHLAPATNPAGMALYFGGNAPPDP